MVVETSYFYLFTSCVVTICDPGCSVAWGQGVVLDGGRTMRWLFLGLSLLLCGLSSLTVVPAWHVWVWQAAILAGEYGHYLAIVSLVLACVAIAYGAVMVEAGQPYWRAGGLAALLALVATGLFLSPLGYAFKMASRLPAKFERAFKERPPRVTLDLRQMWLPWPGVERVVVSTHVFTPTDWAEALQLDFYPASQPNAPVVVVVHGGGWQSGDREQFAATNHVLAQAGYAVAAIDYRLAPEYRWPAQRDDTLQAIAWLKAHATELNIDPGRIVLMGRSAGAQVAGAVAYTAGDPAVRGFVGLYGIYDMNFCWSIAREDDVLNTIKLMTQFLGGAPSPANQADYDSASPQGYATSGRTPPTLLLHGSIDTLCWVEHSRRLTTTLRNTEVPHVYLELPWAVHAFDYNPTGPAGQLTHHTIVGFLAEVTKE